MRILYSAVGDTDPIRGYHDGAMLHILRHYHPDKLVLFLSKEMVEKEEDRDVYTKAIKSVDETIAIDLIKTDLVDVHKIDALMPMVDDFYRLREEYPDSEILLNLSSGTPQMKEIMSYLSIEYDDVVGIQVDSPQKSSNRSEAASQDDEDLETAIGCNKDSEASSPCRCHEPHLNYLKRNRLKLELITALRSYDYSKAKTLFASYQNTFPQNTWTDNGINTALKHAQNRLNLKYKDAIKICCRVGSVSITSVYDECKIIDLDEYLMLMEVRLKQGQIEDFILKISPFMSRLMRFYLAKYWDVRWSNVCEGSKKRDKIDMGLFEKEYPELYRSWAKNNRVYRQDCIEYSLYHLLNMIREMKNVDSTLVSQLESIRKVEQEIRNRLAHEMVVSVEADICKQVGIQSLHSFFQDIRKVFYTIIDESKPRKKLVYDLLNEYIIGELC